MILQEDLDKSSCYVNEQTFEQHGLDLTMKMEDFVDVRQVRFSHYNSSATCGALPK